MNQEHFFALVEGAARFVDQANGDQALLTELAVFIGCLIPDAPETRGHYITMYDNLRVPDLFGIIPSKHNLTEFYRLLLTTKPRAPTLPSRALVDYVKGFDAAFVAVFLHAVCDLARGARVAKTPAPAPAAGTATEDEDATAAPVLKRARTADNDDEIKCREQLRQAYNQLTDADHKDLDVVQFCMDTRCGIRICKYCRRLVNAGHNWHKLHASTKAYINYACGEILIDSQPATQRTFNSMVIQFSEDDFSVKTNIMAMPEGQQGWDVDDIDRDKRLRNYFARRFMWGLQLATVYEDISTSTASSRANLDVDYTRASWLADFYKTNFGDAEAVAAKLGDFYKTNFGDAEEEGDDLPDAMSCIEKAHALLCALSADGAKFAAYFADDSTKRIRDFFDDIYEVVASGEAAEMMHRVAAYKVPKSNKRNEVHADTYLARVVLDIAQAR